MSRPTLVVFAALVACSQAGNPRQPPLPDALRLQTQLASTTVTPGSQVEARFFLRNRGPVPLQFCQTDGGVSIWLGPANTTAIRLVLLNGMVNDVRCNERTTLQPGEEKQFTEKFAVYRDLSGEVDVFALIRVHRVPEQQSGPGELSADIRAEPKRLTVVPAGISAGRRDGVWAASPAGRRAP